MLEEIFKFFNTKAGMTTAGAVFLLFSSVVTGAYFLGRDLGEKELQVYKAAQKIDFKSVSKKAIEATDALKTTSNELMTLLSNSKNYDKLKEQYDKLKIGMERLQTENGTLSSKNVEQQTRIKILEKRLEELTAKNTIFKLKLNKSVLAKSGKINVSAIEILSNSAVINANGTQRKVFSGDIHDIVLSNGRKCSMRVHEIRYNGVPVGDEYVSISLDCS